MDCAFCGSVECYPEFRNIETLFCMFVFFVSRRCVEKFKIFTTFKILRSKCLIFFHAIDVYFDLLISFMRLCWVFFIVILFSLIFHFRRRMSHFKHSLSHQFWLFLLLSNFQYFNPSCCTLKKTNIRNSN